MQPTLLLETISTEMVVQRFATDCAVDYAAERLALECHDIAVAIIASGGIVEGKIDALNDRARRANGFEHRVSNGGCKQSEPLEHQLAPLGTAIVGFLPCGFQLMGALFGESREQGLGVKR